MVLEEVAPAGADTPLHLHHHSDEVMYVLSGEFTFQIGDQVSVGGPGACAFMPRDIPHAWKNTGSDTGRAIFTYAPAEAGKVFEELSRLQRPFAEIVNDPEGGRNFPPPRLGNSLGLVLLSKVKKA